MIILSNNVGWLIVTTRQPKVRPADLIQTGFIGEELQRAQPRILELRPVFCLETDVAHTKATRQLHQYIHSGREASSPRPELTLAFTLQSASLLNAVDVAS